MATLTTGINADGPRSKLINYNGPIGQDEQFHGVAVEFWINNKVEHENEDCHDLDAGWNCTYYVYGLGMRIHNSHSHAINVDLKKSLVFSKYPFTACEAEIFWVDERGAQKKYRLAPGGFVIDANSYLGIGAITGTLGSSPQCFFDDYRWEAKGYNVNLYWQEVIPPPPQPPVQPTPIAPTPPQNQPPQQPAPPTPPPAPPPSPAPVPDPADMQKQMDELTQISQRMQQIAIRAATGGDNYGDAEYCRDMTDLLDAFKGIALTATDTMIRDSFAPLVGMYGQMQAAACDRSNWSSNQGSTSEGRAPGCENFPPESTGMPSPGVWCDTRANKTSTVSDNSKPAPSAGTSQSGSKFGRGQLKKPCQEGVAGCKD